MAHHRKHASEWARQLGPTEYVRNARAFLEWEAEERATGAFPAPAPPSGVFQGRRVNGEICRYDVGTNRFAVYVHVGGDRYRIKTYFKPDTTIHGEATN